MEENKWILTIAEPTKSIKGLLERITQIGYELVHVHSEEELQEAQEKHQFKLALFNINSLDTKPEMVDLLKLAQEKQKDLEVIGLYNPPIEVTNNEIKSTGIKTAYSAGFEDEFIINSLFEFSPIDIPRKSLELNLLTRINISEISSENKLPFDVYVCLPANRKIILYRTKGSELAANMIDKFKKNRDYSLYIRKTDLNSYTEFYSTLLSNIQSDPNLSKVEKHKAISKEIKGLMNGFFAADKFDKDEGDQLLAGVSKVLFQLQDESGSKEHMMEPVLDLVAQNMTTFSHSKNVATYSVLFGTIVGIDEPESLKIGGFLHDIGLGDFDPDLMFKDEADLGEKEFAQYKLHPGNAKLSLIQKNLTIPELSLKMILQHHEVSDGSGFPYGLKGDEIEPAAKICSLADEFDKLTSVRFGYVKFSPLDAINRLAGLDGSEPSQYFDRELHQPILDFFFDSENNAVDSIETKNIENTTASEEKEMDDIAELLSDQPPTGDDETNLGDMFAQAMGTDSTSEKEETIADDHKPLVLESTISEATGVKVIPEIYQHTKPGFTTMSELIQNKQFASGTFDRKSVLGADGDIKEDYETWEDELAEIFAEEKISAA